MTWGTIRSGTNYQLGSGGQPFLVDQAAVLYQGFFVAKQTGGHTFAVSGDFIDNWGYLWIGDVAYSQRNDGNAQVKGTRVGEGPYTSQFTRIQLNAGDAIPITFLWADGGGDARSWLQVTTPLASITNHAGWFVQACSASVFA
jgi:hypothetical protein